MNPEMPALASSSYSASTTGLSDAVDVKIQNMVKQARQANLLPNQPKAFAQGAPMSLLRVVQVYIADVDTSLPVEKRVLYQGEVKVTDATDQELFFEIDIRSLLEKHNLERVKCVNKSVKDRTEHLEPARVRDLKMTVVNIATF